MKKKNLLIILCWFPFLVFAKSDLSKQEKSIVKELKKQYKLEAVEIKRPYEGYVYYSLLSKVHFFSFVSLYHKADKLLTHIRTVSSL